MMSKSRCLLPGLLAALGCLLTGVSASAGPIAPGQWWEFSFSDAGTPATGCFPADPAGDFCVASAGTPTHFLDAAPWTFVAPAAGAILTVTDAFLSGDQFQLFDFGGPFATTSVGAVAGSVNCGNDPVPCLANPGISHGVFLLAAGAHSLSLVPTASPGGGGVGYLRVDPIPEPATLSLLVSGLGYLLLTQRRRRDL